MADLYENTGQSGLANAERVKAVTIRPDLVEVQREIAEWYLARDNTKKAVARYLILAEHYQRVDSAAALVVVERALEINPQHPKALEFHRSLQNPSHPNDLPANRHQQEQEHRMQVIAPEMVGFSSQRLNNINIRLQEYVHSKKVSGFVSLVARDSEVVHYESCGFRDAGKILPMERDTIFRIYSMTKPITSVA